VQRDDAGPRGERVVLGLLDGRAAANLGRGLIEGHREHAGGLELLRARRAHLAPAAGDETFGEGLQRPQPLGWPLDGRGDPEHEHRAVVDGVVEGRAGEHEPVEQRHRQAGRCAGAQRADRAARGGAVEVDGVPHARVQCGDDVGLSVRDEAEVRDQRLVEDRLDRLALVHRAGGNAADPRSSRGGRRHPRQATHVLVPRTGPNGCKNLGPMDLHLDLDSAPGGPLRARVEHALREAVRSGRLAPGTRLPSTRALCAQLGVSRGVVVDAYAQLAAEGYLCTRRGGGTTIAPAVAPRGSPAAGRAQTPRIRYDMSPFRPALGDFPRAAWSAAAARALRRVPDERLGYPDPAGTPELRTALAAYLARARGVRADPEQIVVTNGLRQGIELLWSTLAAAGARRVAVEDPGWRGVRETAPAGLQIVPLPVDGDGLIAERLRGARVDAVALAPAHQYPTGAVLSPARRSALLSWARERGALIVEDDYDAEYRYDRQPIGSLQGLAPEHVVYGGSTSKTIAPAVRLGWLVLPQRLVQPLAALQRTRGGTPSPLGQLALADLIERGDLDRHLRRQRRRYRRQREALLAALATELPEASVHGAAAGLYAVLRLPDRLSERAVLAAARSRGIALEALGGAKPALVIGYANLAHAAIAPAVAALAAGIRAAEPPGGPGGAPIDAAGEAMRQPPPAAAQSAIMS
jgi:GntR family transcriptional regulator/MocR family aminotransferase